jgi:hypothetical protein
VIVIFARRISTIVALDILITKRPVTRRPSISTISLTRHLSIAALLDTPTIRFGDRSAE